VKAFCETKQTNVKQGVLCNYMTGKFYLCMIVSNAAAKVVAS